MNRRDLLKKALAALAAPLVAALPQRFKPHRRYHVSCWICGADASKVKIVLRSDTITVQCVGDSRGALARRWS